MYFICRIILSRLLTFTEFQRQVPIVSDDEASIHCGFKSSKDGRLNWLPRKTSVVRSIFDGSSLPKAKLGLHLPLRLLLMLNLDGWMWAL